MILFSKFHNEALVGILETEKFFAEGRCRVLTSLEMKIDRELENSNDIPLHAAEWLSTHSLLQSCHHIQASKHLFFQL